MPHAAIVQIQQRVDAARSDSDFSYFFSMLLQGEALFKITVLGFLSALTNDPDRNRYRLEHAILRASGLGPWWQALNDSITGPAAQFLLTDFSQEKNELTKTCGIGEWQFDAVSKLKQCLDYLEIEAEDVPSKTDMTRWFRLFRDLRNKTRGHGATLPGKVGNAATCLSESLNSFSANHALFKRPWVFLYRNLSGKYRVTPITDSIGPFEPLKKGSDRNYPNGVYLFSGSPRLVPFLESDADLTDFFFPNGSFTKKSYECLSYTTDNKKEGDGSSHLMPAGTLPISETQGLGELEQLGHCLSNVPHCPADYIPRPTLESDIKKLLLDDRHPIVTLLGRGGIGKTYTALQVLTDISTESRFEVLIWFSARDVDLQFSGLKAVKPHVLSSEDVSKFYVDMVSPKQSKESGFSHIEYFASQLGRNELGACLYVFDNFETVQNPLELFSWIDTHIRLPNKVLITTRLRDFKGDYPVEVSGMAESESRALIERTARELGVWDLLKTDYIFELIKESEGHPYVIKILLGEVAKERRAKNITHLLANRDEILTALFERTYASLSPCAQRIFMTLSAWNSPVPRIALEAVLHRIVDDRTEVERSIDTLLQYSLAERQISMDSQEFLALPLVASVFGKRKFNVSPLHGSIKADVELLQMLGPVSKKDLHFKLSNRIEHFLGGIARKVEKGDSFENYAPIIEMIGRNFAPAWLALARWHRESDTLDGYEKAKESLKRYLEQDSHSDLAAEAWHQLAHLCYKTNDTLGEVQAFIQRAKIASVSFEDLSSTAYRLNSVLRVHALEVDADERRLLTQELLDVMERRRSEANADDMSRMAWLAVRLDMLEKANQYIDAGLQYEPENYHLLKLRERLENSNPHENGARPLPYRSEG